MLFRSLREKGNGYNPTIGTTEYDPFYNYGLSSELVGITQEQSMMARMGEKIIRLRNILTNPDRAGKESIDETCSDIVGIALLVWASTETLSDEMDVTPVDSENLISGGLIAGGQGREVGPLQSLLNWGKK